MLFHLEITSPFTSTGILPLRNEEHSQSSQSYLFRDVFKNGMRLFKIMLRLLSSPFECKEKGTGYILYINWGPGCWGSIAFKIWLSYKNTWSTYQNLANLLMRDPLRWQGRLRELGNRSAAGHHEGGLETSVLSNPALISQTSRSRTSELYNTLFFSYTQGLLQPTKSASIILHDCCCVCEWW